MSANLFAELLASQEILLLRRIAPQRFKTEGERPSWFDRWPEGEDGGAGFSAVVARFPFLEHFLQDAELMWKRGARQTLRSSIWLEQGMDGREIPLESLACQIPDGAYLVIRHAQVEFSRYQKLLQRTRDIALDHERLAGEIDRKEVLLHCLAHDMAGPLTSIRGCLDMIDDAALASKSKELMRLCRGQTVMACHFVRDLLDIFAAELNALGPLAAPLPNPPDLMQCLRQALDGLHPVFALSGISANIASPNGGDAANWRVEAEPSRLERVFYNLIQNAGRHSPPGGEITIHVRPEESIIHIAVEDQGPGVSPEMLGRLFQKFVQGTEAAGKVGLGLFFCRITVERWGGRIGYEPRPEGGARFWFQVRRA